MSAWVVSKAHIDALVSASMQLGGKHERWFRFYAEGHGRLDVRPDTADLVGQLLMDECVRSVSYRYPNDDVQAGELPGPIGAYYLNAYTFEATRPFTPGEIVHMVACYEYQSCEHPGWRDSPAERFCRALEHRLLDLLPGGEHAPWGFEEADVRANAVR